MIEQDILKIISDIENLIKLNKTEQRKTKKELKEIKKIVADPSNYIDVDKVLDDKTILKNKLTDLEDEYIKLKKVLYRQNVCLDFLKKEE